MCIRDRCLVDRDDVVARLAAFHTPSHEPALDRFEIAEVGRCLLYTSDAADDLPCVDLGGRRIIKKKNTYHITFNYTL